MKMREEHVLLDHGEGGAATARLVREVFFKHLGSQGIPEDATVLAVPDLAAGDRLALTTDSFVVQPAIFPGGDIGKLAVAGTVNDLAVMGAVPLWLTAGFILEEGLPMAVLEQVVASMAGAAREAGVRIVAGDTKVVARGDADGIYINTSGIGRVPAGRNLSSGACRSGDVVLVSGPVGDHGTAVMVAREGFGLEGDLRSDCQPLADLVAALMEGVPGVRCMRDPTRGGLATTLTEIVEASKVGIRLQEDAIPIRRPVRTACDLLGLDPLYVACEGRIIVVVAPECADAALRTLRAHPRGLEAARIGGVDSTVRGLVLETTTGGSRILVALEGAQLPRIC